MPFALFRTNYYYFALYESGNRLRELEIQGRSDDDEDEWDKHFFNSSNDISHEPENEIVESSGTYPRLSCEDEAHFGRGGNWDRFMEEYCKLLGFTFNEHAPDYSYSYKKRPLSNIKIYGNSALIRRKKG